MKHEFKVTLFLIALFALAQTVGLVLLKSSIVQTVDDAGNVQVSFDEAKVGDVPEMSGLWFLLYVGIGVAVGTGLVLLLVKFKKTNWWRAWFFLAVFIAIDFALKTFLEPWVATVIAFSLAVWKIYKPNVVIHNLSEILMYSGIAVFLVPLLNSIDNKDIFGIPGNIFWAAFLLVIISVYDFIAVFKSKHMVSMAQFQTESKVFAGLFIPYKIKKDNFETVYGRKAELARKKIDALSSSKKKALPELNLEPVNEYKTAILGGGDIAFPLIFSGTVLFNLASKVGLEAAFLQSMIITATSTIALALLFFYAKKDKFYPAMPIMTAGCFAGYLIILLI